MNISAHRIYCYLNMTYRKSSLTNYQHRRGRRAHDVPPLTGKLVMIDGQERVCFH